MVSGQIVTSFLCPFPVFLFQNAKKGQLKEEIYERAHDILANVKTYMEESSKKCRTKH
jgi:hypothetical protein